jgi:hypothetical protein
MFYFTDKGKAVQIFNKRPRNYSAGGPILGNAKIRDKNEDTISSRLEIGSLVIPVPVMKSGIMKLYKGPLTGPKTNDPRRLTPTIVMPGEIVVHKKHAPAVMRFLKSHGITLPLPQ